ncbi:unnamed protein product [Prunus brigantina]
MMRMIWGRVLYRDVDINGAFLKEPGKESNSLKKIIKGKRINVPSERTSHENFSGSLRNIGPEGKVGQSSQLVHGGLREEQKWKRGERGVQLSSSSQPHQPLAQEETLQTLFSGISGWKRVMRKTMETLEVEGRKRRKSATLIKEGEKATIPVTGLSHRNSRPWICMGDLTK